LLRWIILLSEVSGILFHDGGTSSAAASREYGVAVISSPAEEEDQSFEETKYKKECY
jgi:hypothetical protein